MFITYYQRKKMLNARGKKRGKSESNAWCSLVKEKY